MTMQSVPILQSNFANPLHPTQLCVFDASSPSSSSWRRGRNEHYYYTLTKLRSFPLIQFSHFIEWWPLSLFDRQDPGDSLSSFLSLLCMELHHNLRWVDQLTQWHDGVMLVWFVHYWDSISMSRKKLPISSIFFRKKCYLFYMAVVKVESNIKSSCFSYSKICTMTHFE